MNWLLVIAGGMVGAPLRYLADRAVQARHDTVFPWGTFLANVTGCLLVGAVTGAAAAGAASAEVRLLLGTGLAGALTTYSTFSYETLRLTEDGARLLAAANIAASILAGLGAAFLAESVVEALVEAVAGAASG